MSSAALSSAAVSSDFPIASIGIDFGTSNTVVALADASGRVETLRFRHDESDLGVYASALAFWQDRASPGLPPRVEGGPWAIARALEGRSGLRFIQSFKTFAASRTTFVVAHRLATVRAADQILVMQAGEIVERGNHATLVAANGLYAELARLQFQG